MSNVIFDIPADSIHTLPTDKSELSQPEIQIVETLFKHQHTTIQKMLMGTQDVILVGLLFILFAFPQLDEFIIKLFPTSATSQYILLGIKTAGFMLSYFVLKNIYLVRKP
jgi:uncharacterized membrane protein YqhA